MIIYKTTNLINNKIYVGKDKYNDPNYLGSGRILQNSIKKHGKENFIKEIIEHCSTKEELNQREIYWIAHYNSRDRSIGYNLALGGEGGSAHLGCKHTKETKNKMSKVKKGISYEQKFGIEKANKLKQNNSIKMKGKNTGNKSDKTKQKISDTLKLKYENGYVSPKKGIPKSKEHKEKIKNTLKGRPRPKQLMDNLHKHNTNREYLPHSLETRQKISDTLSGRKQCLN